MKKVILLAFVLLFLTACKGEYIVNYEDGKFTEELSFDSNSLDADEFADNLEANKDEDFEYYHKDNKVYFKGKSVNSFEDLEMFYSCFEKIYVLDEKEYISLITDGDYLCEDAKVTLDFKSDKKIIASNGTRVNDGHHKWKSLDKGISIQISKKDKVEKNNKFRKEINIRLIIAAVVIVALIPTIFILKRKK